MAPFTILLFCHRLPTISPEDFRNYCEEKHVPYVKSLLGSDHPLTHTRYYTNKDSGYLIGSPSATDADLIAVITFENKEMMEQSMRVRNADGVRELIHADEDKFMDRSKVQVVVLGEADVGRSVRDK